MLIVKDLVKNFGSTKALDGVSLTINPGEIFCLIGPNSAGKSTLIKSIAGLLEPTSGSITVDGNDIATHPEEAKKVLGYIPDEPSIWSHMTGEEFLYFTQALYNTEESGRDAAIQELLARFSLSGIEKTNFEDYSRGNKQKFSILAAFSHTPKLLLIDEPIVGLDPIGADIAKKMFKDFAQAGGAVLLVTHTLTVAEEISTNIGFLKDGKLVALGTLPELRTAAKQGEQATLEEVYKALAQ